ncbi:MAG: hypothetical protein ACFB51_09450 [Anaerolineae bacterium]
MNPEVLLQRLGKLLVDSIRILQLRQKVNTRKAEQYDHLAEPVIGLRRALATQERAADDLRAQTVEREQQIERLREEYAALQSRGSETAAESERAQNLAFFRTIQPVVTQLPTIRAAVESGADISAKDVLDLLAPLDEALQSLGFERIGEAGQELPSNPKRHRAVGRGSHSIAPDDPVRVRYVGYLYQAEVVCKAQVTRVQTAEETEAVSS